MSSVTNKLRDSCNACAISKIKCPKERPSCSRCESRNVTCSYSFTKRPGRKPENGSRCRPPDATTTNTPGAITSKYACTSTGNDHNHDANDRSINGDQLASTTHTQATRHPSNSLDALFWSESPTGINTSISNPFGMARRSVVSSPTPEEADSSDMFPMIDDMNDMHGTFPDMELDGFHHRMDDFLESAIESHFVLPSCTPDNSDNTSTTPTHNDIASLLIPPATTMANTNVVSSEAHSAADTGSTGCSSESIFSWPAPALSTTSTLSLMSTLSRSDGPSSGHLAQTLDILKTLSSAPPSPPATAQPTLDSSDADAFTKALLSENQQSIDAVATILSSPSCCGDDGFLLAVMFMTVLKIIERYGAAAHAPIDTNLNSKSDHGQWMRFSGSYSHSLRVSAPDQGRRRTLSTPAVARGHDDAGRETMVAKLVLGELHRVQRVVNKLSRELEKYREGGGGGGGGGGDLAAGGAGGQPAKQLLVTTSTLAQLETDMRKSLNALSTEIIDQLRR